MAEHDLDKPDVGAVFQHVGGAGVAEQVAGAGLVSAGGVQVARREVEDALFTHPALAEVAVIAIPDPKWIEAVAAVVVLREGAAATEEELIGHVRPALAAYKLPKRIFFAESLPKNTAGKLLKRELRTRYSGTATAVMGIENAS